MTSRSVASDRVALQVRVTPKHLDWLREQAELRDVSVSFLVGRALDRYQDSIPPCP